MAAGIATLAEQISLQEMQVLEDGEALPDESVNIMMVIDETAMWTWDWEGNPDKDEIEVL